MKYFFIGLAVLALLTTFVLYCCLIVASREDDRMHLDE